MRPLELRAIIETYPAHQPVTEALQRTLARRGQRTCPPQHPTQKEHWLGWLGDYNGPGFYGRQNGDRSAAFVYNHLLCPPMLLWLAEACGTSRAALLRARTAVIDAPANLATQSARLRRAIPWIDVEPKIGGRP